MTPISGEKEALRAEMRTRAGRQSPEDHKAESDAVCARIVGLLGSCRRVLLYAPLADEVDVWPLAAWMLARDIEVALPMVDWEREQMVAASYWGDEAELETTGPGIRQPRASEELDVYEPSSLDAVIVPGVAFDAAGGRLGRGGGYYDRYLSGPIGSVRAIGAGFTHQMVDNVPREPHDRMVDVLVTPAGVWMPGAAGDIGSDEAQAGEAR